MQFVQFETLIGLAAEKGAVICVCTGRGTSSFRAIHWRRSGQRMRLTEWARRFAGSNITGANRTLAQDLAFAIDQLVEIAIRALSPAVNDTFTALACIDWLGDSLCKVTSRWRPRRVHRDDHGYVRVITAHVSYERLVQRSFEKIRQAGRGMPAVLIRQLDALTKIVEHGGDQAQRDLLLEQAAMILRASEQSVPERGTAGTCSGHTKALLPRPQRLPIPWVAGCPTKLRTTQSLIATDGSRLRVRLQPHSTRSERRSTDERQRRERRPRVGTWALGIAADV